MFDNIKQNKNGCHVWHENMVRCEMAEIDVKFMKGNKETARKMGNTYKPKKKSSAKKKK